jgi:hypothetical protein
MKQELLYLCPVRTGVIVQVRCALFWGITQRTVVVACRRFGTTIIIIIIIIIIGISFMQGICTYIPETNHVPREHCVAAILM